MKTEAELQALQEGSFSSGPDVPRMVKSVSGRDIRQ